MAVVKACRNRMLEDVGRVSISIKIDDRKGAAARLAWKVPSATSKMKAR